MNSLTKTMFVIYITHCTNSANSTALQSHLSSWIVSFLRAKYLLFLTETFYAFLCYEIFTERWNPIRLYIYIAYSLLNKEKLECCGRMRKRKSRKCFPCERSNGKCNSVFHLNGFHVPSTEYRAWCVLIIWICWCGSGTPNGRRFSRLFNFTDGVILDFEMD